MSENRIEKTFAKLRANGKKALITFVTAGDPNLKKSKEIIFELEKSGADIIELGIVYASAQTKEIISEGTYNMGDGETPSVAESRALLQAKQIALEQAGTYVEIFKDHGNKFYKRLFIS